MVAFEFRRPIIIISLVRWDNELKTECMHLTNRKLPSVDVLDITCECFTATHQ